MRGLTIILLLSALAWGCSAFDFFQYRENTGLLAVEKPDGYGSAKFGAVLASTSTADDDFIAMSAGRGEQTIFYRVASEGSLKTPDDAWQRYPTNAERAERSETARGSGAALAGLPVWTVGVGGNRSRAEGCVAIGEPDERNVTVHCQSVSDEYSNIAPGGRLGTDFGRELAAVRPGSDGQWLLAAAGEKYVAVFSSPDKNDRSHQMEAGNNNGDSIAELAAGRVVLEPDGADGEDLIYIAVTVNNQESGEERIKVYLQRPGNNNSYDQISCIADSGAPGFGGAMTTGDLDGDGSDELVVGSGKTDDRLDEVWVYDIAGMVQSYVEAREADVEEGGTEAVDTLLECEDENDASLHRVAAVTPPEAGDGVSCEEACGFGTALAVGDIATDDDGPELVVGAYRAKAKGASNAGAVYIFRGWDREGTDQPFESFETAGRIYDSSPANGKEFGGSVHIGSMAGRNELLVGVTADGKVFIAFCTGVGTNIEAGADITKNADGKVVSTRCRQ